jgi:hypothetical protein
MGASNIHSFNKWRKSDDDGMEQVMGISRQFAHLAGVNLDPKGRPSMEGGSVIAKFSVRPKPLKWKGIKGWERVHVIIKNSSGNASFIVTVDGYQINIGPKQKWNPIKKAADAIEKACNKLKREEPNDR